MTDSQRTTDETSDFIVYDVLELAEYTDLGPLSLWWMQREYVRLEAVRSGHDKRFRNRSPL